MAKKTLPFEAAHTYEAHMRGCVPGVYYKEAICITNLSLADASLLRVSGAHCDYPIFLSQRFHRPIYF